MEVTTEYADMMLRDGMDPLTGKPEWTLRHFNYADLPEGGLLRLTKEYAQLACTVVLVTPAGPSRAAALHDLLRSLEAARRTVAP